MKAQKRGQIAGSGLGVCPSDVDRRATPLPSECGKREETNWETLVKKSLKFLFVKKNKNKNGESNIIKYPTPLSAVTIPSTNANPSPQKKEEKR